MTLEDATPNLRRYIEYKVTEPTISTREIAERLDMPREDIQKWNKNPEIRQLIAKELDEKWEEARIAAQGTMIELAKNGDREAARFILQTLGIIAEQKVKLEATNININVSLDDGTTPEEVEVVE